MKRFNKLARVVVGAVLGAALFASQASAVGITGEIFFYGFLSPTGGTGMANATGVHFLDVAPGSANVLVTDATFDFAALVTPLVDGATFKDFTFTPFSTVSPLWSAGAITFDLLNVQITQQDQYNLGLMGGGVLHAAGFDATPGSWTLTADAASGGTRFGFSSSAVPEPGTMILLGCGILGMAFTTRKQRSN